MSSTTATTSTVAGNNVLSDKVNRALNVRTDTPAMRAALDALASLPSLNDDTSASTAASATTTTAAGALIDARSVRAAIEQDALRRALQFQGELQKLANDATVLRQRVENVAKVADMVGRCVESPIVVHSKGGMVLVGDDDDGSAAERTDVSNTNAWEEERILASHLHLAHKSYVEATQRQIAVDAFLDKFDLGEGEARLLDHYNFEGFLVINNEHDTTTGEGENSNPWSHPNAALNVIGQPSQRAVDDAMAFLSALERLAVIRKELSKTFGSGTASAAKDELYEYYVSEDDLDDDEGVISSGRKQQKQLGTNSALRMMEQLASRQERAHERLYQFVQYYLGIGSAAPSSNMRAVPTSSTDRPSMGVDPSIYNKGALGRFHDGDEMDEAYAHTVIRRSLHVLRNSPAHHVHALELIASSRRTEVTRRFLLALTSGYGGMAPLEMRAHDPVGYVGDMLAFAFRAFRVEGELVKTLFIWKDEIEVEKDGDEGTSKVDTQPNTEDEEGDQEGDRPMGVAEMLSQSMGGLSRPLGTRVKQVVTSLSSQGIDGQEGIVQGDIMATQGGNDDDVTSSSLNRLVALYSVCGLLKFYCSAVHKALEKLQQNQPEDVGVTDVTKNPFFATCDESLTEAADSYVASLRAYGAMLNSHATPMETEAQLAHRAIVQIAEERVASPGFAEDSPLEISKEDVSSKQLSLSFLISTLVDAALPYLRSLDDSASLYSALNSAVKCGLEGSESAKWSELIQERNASLMETLVDDETVKVLDVCGLGGIHTALQQMNGASIEGMAMSCHPGLSQSEVEAAMKQFYSSLFSPPIPTFEEIKDPELRKFARSKTALRVVDVYRELYDAMTSEKGGYADFAFLGHEPDQVKTLLSL